MILYVIFEENLMPICIVIWVHSQINYSSCIFITTHCHFKVVVKYFSYNGYFMKKATCSGMEVHYHVNEHRPSLQKLLTNSLLYIRFMSTYQQAVNRLFPSNINVSSLSTIQYLALTIDLATQGTKRLKERW